MNMSITKGVDNSINKDREILISQLEYFKKWELISSWKTKDIYEVEGNSDLVIMENNDNISALDWVRIEKWVWKADFSTEITSNVFKYINNNNIRTHFLSQIYSNEILVEKCEMVPVECVFRFVATGSFIKREQAIHWDKAIEDGTVLDKPIMEFYYKNDVLTSEWEIISDPMIKTWVFWLPELSNTDCFILLNPTTGKELNYKKVYNAWTKNEISRHDYVWQCFSVYWEFEELQAKTCIISKKIKDFYDLVWLDTFDWKIEFWKNTKWELVLADVIDWDSCRLRIPYTVIWNDGNTYLSKIFEEHELEWVCWKDIEYFEQFSAIMPSMWIKKYLLVEGLDKQGFRDWETADDTVRKYERLAKKSSEAFEKNENNKKTENNKDIYIKSIINDVIEETNWICTNK
jgi:phosphoribosylaminoimidazole-succinocarboxamide synthase